MTLRGTPYSEQYWSEVEILDEVQRDTVQRENLLQQVDYLATKSEFYQEKLAGTGKDLGSIRSLADLQDFPFTEKQELRDSLAVQPLGKHRAADMSEVVQVQASSGTTGSPSYVGLTANDVGVWNELGARALYANGLRPGDLLLHGFGLSKGFVGGVPTVNIANYMGLIDLPIGAEAGAERLLRVLNDFRPASVIGTPFFLSYLAEQAPDIIGAKANELGVRSISVGGEPGAGLPGFRDNMESLWGATVREMLGGTDLAPSFWGECEVGEGMHMLFPDLIAVELIDPETGQVIEPKAGAAGELVYTALRREASPLFRFRTRDHIVVTDEGCACGRTGYKIRCVGRTDDMLIIRGINVFPSAVKELVVSFAPETTGELRIRPDFEGHSSQKPLPITVEYSDTVKPEQVDDLKERIFNRIRSALNFKPVVEMAPEGTLPRPDHVKVALIERELSHT